MSNHLKYVNAIRSMGIQAIAQAKQGHPGMTISAAPINYAIYTQFLNLAPNDHHWINRDRFVLSGGHGSMSLYPILALSGLLDLKEIMNFRQKDSLTPGHPETHLTPFIDASTGPLGQGVGLGVGMAIAEAYLSNQYKDLKGLINHKTFVVAGDGDLQEGVCYEAMSLAGKLRLKNLIMFHDSNQFQLESDVKLVNTESIEQRVISMNWDYISCSNKPSAIIEAIQKAYKAKKPTFIEVKTKIGEGLSFENSAEAHGGSINQDELFQFHQKMKIDYQPWVFSEETYQYFKTNVCERGQKKYDAWNKLVSKYQKEKPERLRQFLDQSKNIFTDLTKFINPTQLKSNLAGRSIIGEFMKLMEDNKVLDTIILSPDISKSTTVKYRHSSFNNDNISPMIYVGIREFGMAAIQNGICLHGGLRCISSSFLSFVDYFKPAIRLGCISHLNPIYCLTHDSVLIGSDGPTHQPIEQVGMLRMIPNHTVYRPCDQNEAYGAFIDAMNATNHSTSLILSRQGLKSISTTDPNLTVTQGGYCIYGNPKKADVILCASGSEVNLAIETAELFEDKSICVYSVPNLNKFLESEQVLSLSEAKKGVACIEASNDPLWYRLSQYHKVIVYQINHYGKSMDGQQLYEDLGYTSQHLSEWIKENYYAKKESIWKTPFKSMRH